MTYFHINVDPRLKIKNVSPILIPSILFLIDLELFLYQIDIVFPLSWLLMTNLLQGGTFREIVLQF